MSIPRSILAVDVGAATTSVALIGRPNERWRLLGFLAAPSPAPVDAIAGVLAARMFAADPDLAVAVGLAADTVLEVPRLESRTDAPQTLAVLAASPRVARLLEEVAARTPWHVRAASPESHDPREMTELALRAEVTAVLVGMSEPPGPDERSALDDIAALAAAAARRRPELRIVLAGPVAARRAWTEGIGDAFDDGPERLFEGPPIGVRSSPDEPLREILEGLLPRATDTRHTAVRAAISLADVLDRRIELIEVGLEGGLRAMAVPGVADQGPTAIAVRTAAAALVPPDPDERSVESVLGWTTGSLDRHRMGDRLRDLRLHPWADASGDGARLRLAAGRAALDRLVEITPEISALPPADLTIAAGGVFSLAPGQAIALAIADVVRRTGATQLAVDHARLLGPLGTIEDPDERRGLVADLADDLLAPLGSLLVVGGVAGPRLRGSRVGALELSRNGERTRHEISVGDLSFVAIAPGDRALATLEFGDAVRFGRRARRLSVPVSGGLAGLLVDIRDVPLHLPDRRDRRRAALAAWGELAWPMDDR